MTDLSAASDLPETGKVGIRELLALVTDRRRSVGIALVLLLTSALLSLAQPVLAGKVIDGVTGADPIGPLLLLLAAVFILDAVVQGFGQFVLLRLGEAVVKDLRTRMLARLVRIRIPVLVEHRLGDLLSRVSTDTVALRSAVSQSLVHLISGGLTVIAAIVLMVVISPQLFLIVLATFVLAALALMLVASRIQHASEVAQDRTGRMTAELERMLGAARTVKMSRAEERETAKLAGTVDDIYAAGVRGARLIATVTPMMNLALTGSFLLVLLFGGIWVTNGTITMGTLTTMLLLALYLVVPVGDVFNALTELKVGMGALVRINHTLDLPIEDFDDDEKGASPRSEPRPTQTTMPEPHAIEFDHVEFSYLHDNPVLRELTLTIPSRSYTALVGMSGAGKSTLFALLCGFQTPNSGRISIDGEDIATLPLGKLRTKISLMEQDAPILHGTVRDNLTYACPDASDEEIATVITEAGLAPVVDRSPLGLDAPVGDRGISLSGGERQRLAFGRTVLAKPSIVLLDEPTAMLDTTTEAQLSQQIRTLSASATVLVIAHRMSTIEAADTVIMLDDGKVVAAGPHTELLRESAEYQSLFGADNRSSRESLGV